MQEISYLKISFVAAASLLVAIFVTFATRRYAIAHKIGVYPNERMVHKGFIPQLGGLGIFFGFLSGTISGTVLLNINIGFSSDYFYILLGSAIIVLIGIYDDLKGLNAPRKFFGQFLAASVLIAAGCRIDTLINPFGADISAGYFSLPLTYLWLIGVTNAMNLLDGLDGLAAGVSFIASVIFAIIAFLIGNIAVMILCLALAFGILGFLKYNYHPASIFMGDTGSLFLGFILASISIKIMEISTSKIIMLIPIIILAVPLGDTTVSFFRRLNSGRHPFKPDKDHLHHRLIYLGLTHLQSVHIIYLLSVLYGIAALLIMLGVQVTGFIVLILTIIFSALGLKRLGYLEARKFNTLFGDNAVLKVERELAPLSMKRFLHRIFIGVVDFIALNLSMILFVWIRYKLGFLEGTFFSFEEIISPLPMILVSGAWIALFVLSDLYSMRWDVSRFDKVRRVSKTIIFGILIWFFITWDGSNLITQSRISIIIYGLLLIVLVNSSRLLIILLEKKLGILEYAPQPTLLVGATSKAARLLKDIRKNPHLLYKVVGFVSKEGTKESFSNLQSLGTYKDIPEIVRAYGIHEILIAINERSHDEILSIVATVENMKVIFKIIPQFYDVVSGHKTEEVIGHPLIRLFPDHMHLWQWIVKRLIDIFGSLFLIIALLPFAILFYLLLLIFGVNPSLQITNVVGKNGRIFGMLNYNVNKRKTWIQHFLYSTQMYKFPELINILLGKMSFVGPRPEIPEHVENIKEKIRFYNRRFQIRPGLTGWAQVKYRYDESLKSIREQYKSDLFYLENMSLTFDLRILMRSLYILLFKRI